jgi:hypothetical protein
MGSREARRSFHTLPVVRVGFLFVVVLLVLGGIAAYSAPGRSYDGEVVVNDPEDVELAQRLEADVRMLADEIGERNVFHPEALDAALDYLEDELVQAGLDPQRQTFTVAGASGSVECHNLEAELRGGERPEEIVVIGAHYDSVLGSPGANDNGSGVAALLALARTFAQGDPPARTLRFVFFVNEEPPFFTTEEMGSRVYARRSAERGEDIRAMVSLETIGYYDDRPDTQRYPLSPLAWIYPDRGDFIAFVANLRSARLLRSVVASFREGGGIPSEAAALPGFIPGVGWSDHWSFWQEGVRAIMVTDTAPFRDPGYHSPGDTPERLDYERIALVVRGMERAVEHLAF